MIGIKLAYYRKKDWKRFIDSIDDKESIHDTWKEWHKSYLKAKKDLIKEGFAVQDIEVDIDELTEYCRLRRIKNDGKARSQFVIDK
ncbi:MAG: hypothetical protein AB2L20_16565 [Mangrovibacterium sp.]